MMSRFLSVRLAENGITNIHTTINSNFYSNTSAIAMVDTNLALVCHSELCNIIDTNHDDNTEIELIRRLMGSKLPPSSLWKLLQQTCNKFNPDVISSALHKCCTDNRSSDDNDILSLLLQEAANNVFDNTTLILLSWCLSPSSTESTKSEFISKSHKKLSQKDKSRLHNAVATLSTKLTPEIRNNISSIFLRQ